MHFNNMATTTEGRNIISENVLPFLGWRQILLCHTIVLVENCALSWHSLRSLIRTSIVPDNPPDKRYSPEQCWNVGNPSWEYSVPGSKKGLQSGSRGLSNPACTKCLIFLETLSPRSSSQHSIPILAIFCIDLCLLLTSLWKWNPPTKFNSFVCHVNHSLIQTILTASTCLVPCWFCRSMMNLRQGSLNPHPNS